LKKFDVDISVEPYSICIISGQVYGARPQVGELFLIEGGAVEGVQTKKSKCLGKRKTSVQNVSKTKRDEANGK